MFYSSLRIVSGLTLFLSVHVMAQTIRVTAPTPVADPDTRVQRVQATAGAAQTQVSLSINTPTGYNASLQVGAGVPRTNVTQASTPVNILSSAYNRAVEINVRFEGTGKPTLEKSIVLWVDSLPPAPLTPIANRLPGGSGTVQIPFRTDDLAAMASANSIRVYQSFTQNDGTVAYSRAPSHGDPAVARDRRSITLDFRNLNPGSYRLVISGLSDIVGNTFSTPNAAPGGVDSSQAVADGIPFSVSGGRIRGEQVEYPQFLQPQNVESEFDPGDRVDTRVVQLYYFRDARRVAELINRNVENLNQQGYDQAQRFAERARKEAEDRIDERRMKEVLAVEAARKTREIERRMQQTRQDLQSALAVQDQLRLRQNNLEAAMRQADTTPESIDSDIQELEQSISELNRRIQSADAAPSPTPPVTVSAQATAPTPTTGNVPAQATANATTNPDSAANTEPSKAELEQQKQQATIRMAALKALQSNAAATKVRADRVDGQVTDLQETLDQSPNQLSSQLTDAQQQEITTRNAVVTAEARELRAAEERFRRELSAGLADPDTYAQGKMTSIDPVTQVTISVVGTARIQLRGPVNGINKICRLIHQIDSPVGQVKIGIHTVQVNGEHGDRMDYVYEKVNREVAHSRFLVNTSTQLLRRAVAEVASEVALAADQGYLPDNCPPDLSMGFAPVNGTSQTSASLRNRRYLYAFFGSDFIGELEEMDSELLNSENKMLSLNSMDTISLAGALSVTALADAPIRERIIMRVQELLASELPNREVDYVRALTHTTRHGKTLQNRFRKAMRLDSRDTQEIYFNASRTYTFPNTITFFKQQIPGQGVLNPVQYATIKLAQTLKAQLIAEMELNNLVLERSLLEARPDETENGYRTRYLEAETAVLDAEKQLANVNQQIKSAIIELLEEAIRRIEESSDPALKTEASTKAVKQLRTTANAARIDRPISQLNDAVLTAAIDNVNRATDDFAFQVGARTLLQFGLQPPAGVKTPTSIAAAIVLGETATSGTSMNNQFSELQDRTRTYLLALERKSLALSAKLEAEKKLFSKRLLDQFIDEQEEKSVELMEALRAHSSNVDNYLKRLAVAIEDDVQAQFYEPAFQRIRRVSRTWDVTLGQIETTTVLTNNRTLAKVSPSATFEFDLPKRDILLAEALNGSKALATEYGNLLKDGTFLAGAEMLSGQPATAVVGDNAPMQAIPGLPANHQFGSDLQQLIPDPEIYKFETGTGFEIRPVIQPDGHSIVYTFDYLYSTNVREPVRADEKHLGRVKRHFVHTDVQTSSYELREISRYTVALKASRTGRGVPLFEDIPVVGAAFRPLPSDESSLQTNIILGSSTIYPTVFDLMGLRWSRYVDDLASPTLADKKQIQADRRNELRQQLLHTTTGTVNKRIGLPTPSVPSSRHVQPGFKLP